MSQRFFNNSEKVNTISPNASHIRDLNNYSYEKLHPNHDHANSLSYEGDFTQTNSLFTPSNVSLSTIKTEAEISHLVVDGYVCPPEFLSILTPMEFEEIVGLFRQYDTNRNNSIDKHEVRKVLLNLSLDSSLENAEKLLALVDKENTGEITFNSFCRFIVLIKQGDTKMQNYKNLLSKLQDTPLGQLEYQAKLRKLNIRFFVKTDQGGVTSLQKSCIVELHLTGSWQESEDGKVVEKYMVKRFQGIGKTSREAKYHAATNALLKLGDTMPGIKFKEGEFPSEWLTWVDDNLARGVDPITITSMLASKGFHPHRNIKLMQRIITWQSFDSFLKRYPDLDIISSIHIDSLFKLWITETITHGIDGEILLQVLTDRSFDMMSINPYLAQQILNNDLIKDNLTGHELLDFYLACEKGYVDEVKLYCSCHMPVNEEVLHRRTNEALRPLVLAAMNGHLEVVKILLEYKADVHGLDRRGRTALHYAAFRGHTRVCDALISHGVYIFHRDYHGNTALHLSALGNHYETTSFLAYKSQSLIRYVTTNSIKLSQNYQDFESIIKEIFLAIPTTKLKKTDTQRFEKLWLLDASNSFKNYCDENIQFMLPFVSEDIVTDVLARFDPHPETGIFLIQPETGKQIYISTIANAEELVFLVKRCYFLAAIDILNNMHRTPLHVACDVNYISSHAKVIDLLVNTYGSNLYINDKSKKHPMDLLIADKYVYTNQNSGIHHNLPTSHSRSVSRLQSRMPSTSSTIYTANVMDNSYVDESYSKEKKFTAILTSPGVNSITGLSSIEDDTSNYELDSIDSGLPIDLSQSMGTFQSLADQLAQNDLLDSQLHDSSSYRYGIIPPPDTSDQLPIISHLSVNKSRHIPPPPVNDSSVKKDVLLSPLQTSMSDNNPYPKATTPRTPKTMATIEEVDEISANTSVIESNANPSVSDPVSIHMEDDSERNITEIPFDVMRGLGVDEDKAEAMKKTLSDAIHTNGPTEADRTASLTQEQLAASLQSPGLSSNHEGTLLMGDETIITPSNNHEISSGSSLSSPERSSSPSNQTQKKIENTLSPNKATASSHSKGSEELPRRSDPNPGPRITRKPSSSKSVPSLSRKASTASKTSHTLTKISSHSSVRSNTSGTSSNSKYSHISLPNHSNLTATKAKEDLLIEQRRVVLDRFFDDIIAEERQLTIERRGNIMKECILKSENITEKLWHIIRQGSILRNRYKDWEVYEDPDNLNIFYTQFHDDPLYGTVHTNYSYKPCLEYRHIRDRQMGLDYQRSMKAKVLRKFEYWEMLQCTMTGMTFYFHLRWNVISYRTPEEGLFENILKNSRRLEILGYSNEWEERKDIYENKFYYNINTKSCQWEPPIDAVRVTAAERYCTAYKKRDAATVQKWYTCDQCNRSWNSSTQGTKQLLKLCEPCVYRCHKGHKGVRVVRTSGAICNCLSVGEVAGYHCQACRISPQQINIMRQADILSKEHARKRLHDTIMPPVLAMVPSFTPSGEKKVYSGWLLCRRVPLEGLEKAIYHEDSEIFKHMMKKQALIVTEEKIPSKNVKGQALRNEISPICGDISSDSESDMEKDEDIPENVNELRSSSPSRATTMIRDASLGLKRYDFEYRTHTVIPDNITQEESSAIRSSAIESTRRSNSSNEAMYQWVEVFDPEEPEILPIHGKVLISQQNGQHYTYGTVLQIVKPGFYMIEYLDKSTVTLYRNSLTLLSTRIFYFNIHTGQSVWNLEDIHRSYQSLGIAADTSSQQLVEGTVAKGSDIPHPSAAANKSVVYNTQPLSLPGNEWIHIYQKSVMRREFQGYDEMFSPTIDLVFYVDVFTFRKESAVRKIQKFVRQKRLKLHLVTSSWISNAFMVDMPNSVYEECRVRNGWSYLRRHAYNKGEFRDVYGVEWEEYVHHETSEYFYWTEETNQYQWDKPEIPNRKKGTQELFKLKEEVLYRFPNRTQEEVGVIEKLRFDDETGEDMYDLHPKFRPEERVKWIPHVHIKRIPLEGEALTLQRYENAWIRQLRRHRETAARRKKREREQSIEKEMMKLRDMKIMQGILQDDSSNPSATSLTNDNQSVDGNSLDVFSLSVGKDASLMQIITNKSITHENIMRGRVLRIDAELSQLREERDRTEGQRRRDEVKACIEEIKAKSPTPLSRAEILSLSRSIEMQIRLKERMEKQRELQIKAREKSDRMKKKYAALSSSLADTEGRMTTPRSIARRHVIREVHIAMRRQEDKMILCDWGCCEWVRMGYDQTDHHNNRCRKRIVTCALGCDLRMTEEEWLSRYDPDNPADVQSIANSRFNLPSHLPKQTSPRNLFGESNEEAIDSSQTRQHYHEIYECRKRLVYCPRQCLEWIPHEELEHHMSEHCTKRPAKPIYCRLGCDEQFGGVAEKLLQAEDERLQHETEECIYRMVRCNWRFEDGKYCAAQMMAKDRDEHRDYHLGLLGVTTYGVPGTYLYKVPSKVTKLKVQVWGAGGGSGFFRNRRGGAGGGGAFVEVMLHVEPYEVLEIVVGSGGSAGVSGTEIEFIDLTEQRSLAQSQRSKQTGMNGDESLESIKDGGSTLTGPTNSLWTEKQVIDEKYGVATGGLPGGGDGYGGGSYWAAGGGGGYSIVSKRNPQGNQALILAAGGGGGSSLDGLPGAAMDGPLPGTKIDIINGTSATCEYPGKAGWSGTLVNSKWPATDGEAWKGGNGSEYGGGGGGGYYGGGGGGTTPGIGGAGGGGSSYVYAPRAYDSVMILGHGRLPGGLQHNPPDAVGIGDWDKIGGLVGEGGIGDSEKTRSGNNGCVRIFKPGHY